MEIVDAHQHFWRPPLVDIPWLAGSKASFGDPALIRGVYRPQEYLHDAGGLKIRATVNVEAAARPEHALLETAWLTGISDAGGLPTAHVAYADLERPDLEEVLDEHAGSPLLRGVRMRLNYHEPSGRRMARAGDVMAGDAFRRGLAKLAARDLVFNLSIFSTQLADAAAMAAAVPKANLVLEHFGWPIASDQETFEAWRKGMTALAACPNVTVKLSGFWAVDPEWRADIIAPWVLETFAAFGPDRCLFGSNLPIEKLMCPLPKQVQILEQILARETAETLEKFFSANARRVYRLE